MIQEQKHHSNEHETTQFPPKKLAIRPSRLLLGVSFRDTSFDTVFSGSTLRFCPHNLISNCTEQSLILFISSNISTASALSSFSARSKYKSV